MKKIDPLLIGFIAVVIVLAAIVALSLDQGPKEVAESQSSQGMKASFTITSADQLARQECISLCRQKLNEGMDLSAGPCLSESIVEDWVCDVAHSPRADVDDDPANQCSSFGDTANHFVEVSPKCEFIRQV